MLEGMMIGSECADWWEKQNKAYHAELEEYVLENPGNFAIFVATAKATGADFFNTMYVDLARIGEGAADGSLKGIVQDVFRVMNFIPEGKILQGSKTLLGRIAQRISNLTIWRHLDGGLCAPIAIGQALQRAGYRIGISVAEVAKAIGLPLDTIAKSGVDPGLIRNALSKLGLRFSEIDTATRSGLASFDAVKKVAGREAGPLLVGIKIQGVGGHRIVVGQTLGGIKIIDRYGIFNTLEELSRHYNKGTFVINTSAPMFSIANAIIDPSLMKLVHQADVLAVLVRQSLAVFDINFSKFSSVEQLDADFEKFLERKGKKKVAELPDVVIVGGYTIEVTPGDPNRSTLSGISKAQYGTMDLWPLIFDLNKEKIGNNPNRLKPGTKLLLLPIERYTVAEIADARRRAPTWRNYPT